MKNIIWLIIGLILFGLGGYQNTQYEEHSLLVTATITDIKTVDDTGDGPTSYKHTYYGEYTVDGTLYTNKKLTTTYTNSSWPDLHTGDTVEIRVKADNPSKKEPEGGFVITVGVLITVYNAYVLIKRKKAKKNMVSNSAE